MYRWWATALRPEHSFGPVVPRLLGKRLLLRWRAQDMIQAGERWLFTLKLRVPWGCELAVLTIVAGFWPKAILLISTKTGKGC